MRKVAIARRLPLYVSSGSSRVGDPTALADADAARSRRSRSPSPLCRYCDDHVQQAHVG